MIYKHALDHSSRVANGLTATRRYFLSAQNKRALNLPVVVILPAVEQGTVPPHLQVDPLAGRLASAVVDDHHAAAADLLVAVPVHDLIVAPPQEVADRMPVVVILPAGAQGTVPTVLL